MSHSRLMIVAAVIAFSSAAQADVLFVDDDSCPGPGDLDGDGEVGPADVLRLDEGWGGS